jgi:hypothetical protein
MPTKDINKRRKATRERVRRHRERKKAEEERRETVTPLVTIRNTPVTPAEIENLPLSLKAQLNAETRRRQVLKIPDNLKERQEAMVRRFRGF